MRKEISRSDNDWPGLLRKVEVLPQSLANIHAKGGWICGFEESFLMGVIGGMG